MRIQIQREYDKLRAKGWHAQQALRAARTEFSWWRREAGEHDEPDATHCVRLRCEPDEGVSCFEDLCGDTFNPRANPDIPAARLERGRQEFLEECNRDGVWGVIAQYWDETTQRWETADSLWGLVGNDVTDIDCTEDLKAAALRERARSVRAWRNMCKAAP